MSDIILPSELAETELSLADIGAIFVLYSLNKISEESTANWSKDKLLSDTVQDLIEKDIIKISTDDDDENIMTIDISKLERPKIDFWQWHENDENENSVYYHYAHYGDDNGCWSYLLYPRLVCDKVVWDLRHSEHGIMNYFETLEDAEYVVKEYLKEELENIELENLRKSNE